MFRVYEIHYSILSHIIITCSFNLIVNIEIAIELSIYFSSQRLTVKYMKIFIYLQPYLSKYLNVMGYMICVHIEYTAFNFKCDAKSDVNPTKIHTRLSKNKSKTMKKTGFKTNKDDEYFFHVYVGFINTSIVYNLINCRSYLVDNPDLKC